MTLKYGIKLMVTAIIAICIATPAAATSEKAIAILTKVDENLTKVEDSIYDGVIKVIRNGKVTKNIEFNVRVKGITMKLVKFTAPGDIRGMMMLTTKNNMMYVYLPSYKRVRRVANHVLNQGFMGTDISPDDMASSSFSEGWNAVIAKEDDDQWILSLKPKAGRQTTYASIMLTVKKSHGQVTELKYFSAQGKHVKTQTRGEFKMFGHVIAPTLFEFKNILTGTKTIMEFTDLKVNNGIPDSAFTKRAILRGN
ncbi:MAG: outer membrane lipoprotein-sorting protein [Proteobacteria bacterium]|nr:outer membrane lipoprotein-sorting protein [Pseudomonadota bacterium]